MDHAEYRNVEFLLAWLAEDLIGHWNKSKYATL